MLVRSLHVLEVLKFLWVSIKFNSSYMGTYVCLHHHITLTSPKDVSGKLTLNQTTGCSCSTVTSIIHLESIFNKIYGQAIVYFIDFIVLGFAKNKSCFPHELTLAFWKPIELNRTIGVRLRSLIKHNLSYKCKFDYRTNRMQSNWIRFNFVQIRRNNQPFHFVIILYDPQRSAKSASNALPVHEVCCEPLRSLCRSRMQMGDTADHIGSGLTLLKLHLTT